MIKQTLFQEGHSVDKSILLCHGTAQFVDYKSIDTTVIGNCRPPTTKRSKHGDMKTPTV